MQKTKRPLVYGFWSEKETSLLIEAWHDGFTAAEIAKHLNRTRSAVLGKLYRLGLQKKYAHAEK